MKTKHSFEKLLLCVGVFWPNIGYYLGAFGQEINPGQDPHKDVVNNNNIGTINNSDNSDNLDQLQEIIRQTGDLIGINTSSDPNDPSDNNDNNPLAIYDNFQNSGGMFDPRSTILSRFSSIVEMVNSTLVTNFGYVELSKRLQNYACHCFPLNDKGQIIGGKGAVQNDVDRLCKQLYDCHSCISDKECADPGKDTDRYNFYIDTITGQIDCGQDERSLERKINPVRIKCKKAMCECDRTFAQKLGGIWMDDDFDLSLWFNNKNIQKHKKNGKPLQKYEKVCQKKSNKPNTHECCGRMLFNPIMKECCTQSIVSIGNC